MPPAPLSPKGRKQAAIAGVAIGRLDLEIDACLTSPRVRALETALPVCEALGIEPEVVDSIGDGTYDTLELATGARNVLIVGHEPVLSMEVTRITGATVKMKKCGLVGFEPGIVRLLLRPSELAAIAAD